MKRNILDGKCEVKEERYKKVKRLATGCFIPLVMTELSNKELWESSNTISKWIIKLIKAQILITQTNYVF